MKRENKKDWYIELRKEAEKMGFYKGGKLTKDAALKTLNQLYKNHRTSQIPRIEDVWAMKNMADAVNNKYGYNIHIDEKYFRVPFQVKCPYCGKSAKYIESKYCCEECDARVGVIAGTSIPLGKLANKELREMRAKVHSLIDPIWKKDEMMRRNLYAGLAAYMGIPMKETSIGRFDLKQCEKAIRFIEENY